MVNVIPPNVPLPCQPRSRADDLLAAILSTSDAMKQTPKTAPEHQWLTASLYFLRGAFVRAGGDVDRLPES